MKSNMSRTSAARSNNLGVHGGAVVGVVYE